MNQRFFFDAMTTRFRLPTQDDAIDTPMEKKFIGLAPMEGVTDFPARLWFSLMASWDVMCTPFLRVTRDFPLDGEPPADFCPELTRLKGFIPYPLIPQILTTDAQRFAEVALHILPDSTLVDLNCGCPAPKVVGKGGGSGLLSHPDVFFTLINDIIMRLGPGVLSVKMRTGFHNDEEFGGLLAGLMNSPLYWLNVHGRTRDDRYRGEARWDYATQAATRLAWPVVGSGDIVSHKKLEALMPFMRPLGGVFVGRGALRNPWLYHELRTGRQVTISFGLLRAAIYVYAYLAHAASVDLERLINLCKEIDFSTPCHDNHDQWSVLLEKLSRALAPVAEPPAGLSVSSKVLGRIKMIWRSLRTSLPACFMDQSMTRSQTLVEFMSALEIANKTYQSKGDDNLMTLRHDPNMDHWFAR